MLERLRAQAEEEKEEARKGGYEEGGKWANDDADLEELKDLKAYSENKISRDELSEDPTDILDPDEDDRHDLFFCHREKGFIEGAVAAFEGILPDLASG